MTGAAAATIAGDRLPFDLRIFAKEQDGYPIEIRCEKDYPRVPVQLDLNALQREEGDPQTYGRLLGSMIFTNTKLGGYLDECRSVAEARECLLAIRIRADIGGLDEIHWERLCVERGGIWAPVAADSTKPLSRFVPTVDFRPRHVIERPLRAVVVTASPSDLDDWSLDAISAEERQALRRMFCDLPGITPVFLETGTDARPNLPMLRRALSQHRPALVHFLCHGRRTTGGTVLYLENDAGAIDPVAAPDLVEILSQVTPAPVLCFLAACETATRRATDAFLPIAMQLTEAGASDAVIAMSAAVSLATAQTFTAGFYRRLLAHGFIDLACNEARGEVRDELDWGVPVLFSRVPDNRLLGFGVDETLDRSFGISRDTVDLLSEILRERNAPRDIACDLAEQIAELEKSHKVLVDRAKDFRLAGRTREELVQKFDAFEIEFKAYVWQQTWRTEKSACGEVARINERLVPKLVTLEQLGTTQAEPALRLKIEQLKSNLQELASADGDFVAALQVFVGEMDAAIDRIAGALRAGDPENALHEKLDFERQMQPLIRSARDYLVRMDDLALKLQPR